MSASRTSESSCTLLIVEPNIARLGEMTRHFLQAGFVVTPVRHPRQALEASNFKRFDAAILSDPLPEIRTTELARRLRNRIRDLQAVVVSPEDLQWEEIEGRLASLLACADSSRESDAMESPSKSRPQKSGLVTTG